MATVQVIMESESRNVDNSLALKFKIFSKIRHENSLTIKYIYLFTIAPTKFFNWFRKPLFKLMPFFTPSPNSECFESFKSSKLFTILTNPWDFLVSQQRSFDCHQFITSPSALDRGTLVAGVPWMK